jgi:hypothetical protein
MGALKQGKTRTSGRGHAAPRKRLRHSPAQVATEALPGQDDATLLAAPIFEDDAMGRDAGLEGTVDDWAGIDAVADMIDEPAEGRRRR